MPRIDRSMLRRAVATGFATLSIAAALVTAGPAAGDELPFVDVLDVEADTEVVLDPLSYSVDTTHTYTFVNNTFDQSFTSFFETLPWDAENVEIMVDGKEVQGVGTVATDGFAEWFVPFPEPIESGSTAEVTIQWHRSNQRSNPADAKLVSASLISILPYAVAEPGPSTLTVVLPDSFTVIEAGTLIAEPDSGDGLLRLTADLVPYEAVAVVAEDNDGLIAVPLDDPTGRGLDLTLSSLQVVDGWLQPELPEMLKELAAWMPVTPPAPIEIRQGWTGGAPSRLAQDGAIILAPDVEPWLALEVVAQEWLATAAIAEPGFSDAAGTTLARMIATESGAAPEQSSDGRWLSTTDLVLPAAGVDGWRLVIEALEARINPYAGAEPLSHPRPADWRTLVDLFEFVAGVAEAPAAFRFGVSNDQAVELDRRATALIDYTALRARAAPWNLPPLLRDPMASWDFDSFFALQASVSDLVIAREEMVVAAEHAELEVGDFVQTSFEQAVGSMDDAWTIQVEQREALDHVGEALHLSTNDRGLLARIGVIGSDIDVKRERMLDSWADGDFARASHEAEVLTEEIEAAVGRGTLRLLLPLGGLILLGVGFRGWRRRGDHQTSPEDPPAEDQDSKESA